MRFNMYKYTGFNAKDGSGRLLRTLAKSACKKCYGRGHIGMSRRGPIPCKCLKFTELPISWIKI